MNRSRIPWQRYQTLPDHPKILPGPKARSSGDKDPRERNTARLHCVSLEGHRASSLCFFFALAQAQALTQCNWPEGPVKLTWCPELRDRPSFAAQHDIVFAFVCTVHMSVVGSWKYAVR